MVRSILYMLLFTLLSVSLSSCMIHPDDMKEANPEGRTCKHLWEIFRMPPVMNCKTDNHPGVPAGSKVCDEARFVVEENPDEVWRYIDIGDNTFVRPKPGIGVTTWLVNTMETIMGSANQAIYEGISGNTQYQRIMAAALILSIMFFAIAMVLGLVQATPYTSVMLAIKIFLVYTFATDWTGLFKPYVVDSFEGLVSQLSGLMANIFAETGGSRSLNDTFLMVDNFIDMIFGLGYVQVLLGLAFSLKGIIYAVLMLMMMWIYLWAILGAVKTYLIAFIARSLLYAVAPLFLIFALFSQTRSLFDGWLEQLINFSLQPIFLFAFLGLFHLIMMGFMGVIVDMDIGDNVAVCYRPFISLGSLIDILFWWELMELDEQGREIRQVSPPMNIWVMLMIIVLSGIMGRMINWSVEIAARMSSGFITATGVPVQGWDVIKKTAQSPIAALRGGVIGGLGGAISGRGAGRGAFTGARDAAANAKVKRRRAVRKMLGMDDNR